MTFSSQTFNQPFECAHFLMLCAPKTFSSKIFELPMSVSFGSDWHTIDDFTDLVTVARKQEDWELGFNIVTNAKVAVPVSGAQIPFPEDFTSWIKSNPDFILS